MKQISAIRVETLERVQQTSNVIGEATAFVGEVTVEAQVCLPTFLSVFKFFSFLIMNCWGGFKNQSTALSTFFPKNQF